MKLSVITTLYRSAPYIVEFCSRIKAAAVTVAGNDYEVILVNDGSPDDSLAIALSVAAADPHIKVIDLSRNFGHHKAIVTGLSHTTGDRVFLIDIDLEERPEWVIPFSEHMDREGCDLVYGVQNKRKGGWFERVTGKLFYSIFALFTGVRLPANWVTAAVMSRRFVDALVMHDEREMFLGGLYHLTGFEHRPFPIDKVSSSPTTYNLSRKLSLLVNAITSFSSLPLVWIFYLGLLISLAAFIFTIYLVIGRLFLSVVVEGWTSVIASVWLLGGMCICFIGVIGIYVSKTYSEAKRRPYSVIRQKFNFTSEIKANENKAHVRKDDRW